MSQPRVWSAINMVAAALRIGLLVANPAAAEEADEITAMRAASTAYIKALNDGDREKLAAAWTPDGDYVDATGRASKARQLIEHEFGRSEPTNRSGLRLTVTSIRLVSPSTAIEDGTTEHRGEADKPLAHSRYTAYWVKHDGRWLLDSLRESIVPLPPQDSRFSDLEWLLGAFVGSAADRTHVVTSAVVSPDGKFILRDIVITQPDGSMHSTTQRIGWDSSINSFRSWTFDTDGAFGEGVWTRQGNNWIVNTTGKTPTGKPKSARNIYHQINGESFVVASVGSMVGDELLPDLKVLFKRYSRQE